MLQAAIIGLYSIWVDAAAAAADAGTAAACMVLCIQLRDCYRHSLELVDFL